MTSQDYQQQFDQLVGQQGFCLVDVSGYSVGGQDRYAAIWEKKSCPQFVARHGMTSQQYQQQFDQLVGQQGFRLTLVDDTRSAARTVMQRFGKSRLAPPLWRGTA